MKVAGSVSSAMVDAVRDAASDVLKHWGQKRGFEFVKELKESNLGEALQQERIENNLVRASTAIQL